MSKHFSKDFPLASSMAVAVTLLITGCAAEKTTQKPAAAEAAPVQPAMKSVKLRPDQVLATVNGRTIAKSALAGLPQEQRTPEMEAKATEEIIARELIAQDFNSKDYSNDTALMEQIENLQRLMYSQLASDRYMKSINVSDAELRKFYDEKQPELASQQYKLRHILVADEAKAKEIIEMLNKGTKFDKLVKQFSKDDSTKNKGGDLGWVDPRAMGPNFGQVLSKMQNGAVAPTPIQSQFGWHVISREDARSQPAPPFDAIKDKLANVIRMEKFQQHLQSLRAKATISKGAQ